MTRNEAIRQTRQQDVLRSLGFTAVESESLRRISLTLSRWSEHECNGAIQRDGDNGDGVPYWFNTTTGRKIRRAADRERGAMRRLASIIDKANAARRTHLDSDGQIAPLEPLAFYVQGDPRGAALYIMRPGDVPTGADVASYYTRGICVY